MWLAGERIVVAQTIEDEPLCRIEPLRAHSCDEERAIALEVRRLQGLERYVDAQSGGPGKGWFRIVYGPRAGPSGRRARPARGRDRSGMVEPARLLRGRRLHPRRRRSRDRATARARRPQHLHRPLGQQRLCRRGARGRHERHLHQRLQCGSERQLPPLRSLPASEPGRGGEHAEPGRDAGPLELLPGDRRTRADARLSARPAVQPQGADEARRLLRPAADRQPHADRGRPHERAGARAGADDRGSPPLPARLEPHRHRGKLDRRRASGPLPDRRLRLGHARRRLRPGGEDPPLSPLPRSRPLLRRRPRDRHRRVLLPPRPVAAEPGRLPVPGLSQRCRVPAASGPASAAST